MQIARWLAIGIASVLASSLTAQDGMVSAPRCGELFGSAGWPDESEESLTQYGLAEIFRSSEVSFTATDPEIESLSETPTATLWDESLEVSPGLFHCEPGAKHVELCNFEPTCHVLLHAADQRDPKARSMALQVRRPWSPAQTPEVVAARSGKHEFKAGRGRAGDPPPGTMFILKFGGSLDGEPIVRPPRAPDVWHSPRAGLVLSRPPGEYSQDWIGVAISAGVR
jgi:hypothetical protein